MTPTCYRDNALYQLSTPFLFIMYESQTFPNGAHEITSAPGDPWQLVATGKFNHCPDAEYPSFNYTLTISAITDRKLTATEYVQPVVKF